MNTINMTKKKKIKALYPCQNSHENSPYNLLDLEDVCAKHK